MSSICFRWHPVNWVKQTSPDVLPVEELPVCTSQTWGFGCPSHLYSPDTNHTTSDQHTEYHTTICNPADMQLFSGGFMLSRIWKFAVLDAILTWCLQYIPQDFPHVIYIFLSYSTPANHANTSTITRCEWIWIKRNYRPFQQWVNPCDTTTLHAPICPSQWF